METEVRRKVRPLGARIIVRPDQIVEKVKNGIIIPGMAQERPVEGLVLHCGPEAKNVAEGDRIMYGKYSGSEIKNGDETLLIMLQDDVLAVLEADHG